MKLFVVLLSTLALASSCVNSPQPSHRAESEIVKPSGDWLVTDSEAGAEYAVHIEYELRDALGRRQTTKYLRRVSWGQDVGFIASSVISEDGRGKDGKGAGANHSLRLTPQQSFFELDVSISWRGDGKNGKFGKKWQLLELRDQSLVDGPFRANIRIEKKGANQAPEPTPGSVTPRAAPRRPK